MIQENRYAAVRDELVRNPRQWLVTGAAGFIGSNLVEELLNMNQQVVGLDNFSTGKEENLDEIRWRGGKELWSRFRFLKADIRDLAACREACQGIDIVLHQAAMGSVPWSLEDPLAAHENNVTGTLNMLTAARDAGVSRFVYAASSAVYGDHPGLPKVEEEVGAPLSPYAVTKYANELYARVFSTCYGLPTVGLRYFNVFGRRQDPEGPYAAVIPKWIEAMARNLPLYVNGTGENSRDFCYIANVVQANLLAATSENPESLNTSYNVACASRTTLNDLFEKLRSRLELYYPHLAAFKPIYRDFRAGDILHSVADIGKAKRLLGYAPTHDIDGGLDEALLWYMTCAN